MATSATERLVSTFDTCTHQAQIHRLVHISHFRLFALTYNIQT